MEKIDNLQMIWGDKSGRFPFSNSIYIADKVKTVIDTGAGHDNLEQLSKEVGLVINSHYHLDHIRYNHLFLKAEVIVHQRDIQALASLTGFAKKYGAELVLGSDWVENWEREIVSQRNSHPEQGFVYEPDFYKSIGKVDGIYSNEEQFSFGYTKMEVIHAPGHSEGHCCFFFPKQGLCFATDYNIGSDFGPWYGGDDSDIDELLSSVQKLVDLDAKYYVNSHDQKIFTKEEFHKGVRGFLDWIDAREEKITNLLDKGYSFTDLCNEGIFYKKKYLVLDWVLIWEVTMLIKHLQRLKKSELMPKNLANAMAANNMFLFPLRTT
ncbi:MAG: Hydroxyacylglutathione hydrolase [Syntrophomonadaceae bacterium]|nr:Hydroxyacylglutathione hydrolase [Bacillota bacterium]